MYHHFLAPQSQISTNWVNVVLTAISALAALWSVYFAFKTIQQNKISQIPILEPEIDDVTDPHTLKLVIKNIGNGIAKNVKAKFNSFDFETGFDSDLLPSKFQDYKMFTLTVNIPFPNGSNPLFQKGELLLTYQDIWGKYYSTKAIFKPDIDEARRLLGHVNKFFSGVFYTI